MDPNGSAAGSDSHNGGVGHQRLEQVVIRFAGDSGDGMQLTGDRFTSDAALFGNDLATQPNYPAEIRAPAGTLPGVSSFQIQIADHDILTAGDRPDVLVAMNPAALKANIGDLPRGGMVIANSDEFTKRNLTKVGYVTNPLESDELSDYVVHSVAMTTLTLGAVEAIGASKKDGQRAKNMFALGLLSWMYGRPIQTSERFIREKFARKPDIAEANVLALKAGWNYGETTEAFGTTYEVSRAKLPAGEYRQISGNTALAYGIVAAGQLADIPVVLGSYPITPASDILHELSKHKNFNVITFQAEDEIGGICAAHRGLLRRRSGGHQHVRAGHFAQVRSDGPRRDDGTAAAGHRRAAGRPLDRPAHQDRAGRPAAGVVRPQRRVAGGGAGATVAVGLLRDRPRGGPHRGLLPHPGDPVVRRRDRQRLGAVANPGRQHAGARSRTPSPSRTSPSSPITATPRRWLASSRSRARPAWSTASAAWKRRTARATSPTSPSITTSWCGCARPRSTASRVPDLEVDDPTGDAELLLIGWGSSYGPIGEACRRARRKGVKVAHTHLRYLSPFPANLGDVLRRYPQVVAPEMNLGQLALVLRGKYLVDVQSVTKVQGVSFLADEIGRVIRAALAGTLAEIEQDKAMVARLSAATVGAGASES